ncbi:hypothetical protein AMECASPLE_034970 [Ameca splendens]|uniref:Uncharacterized protein n=1 Tax=Ameca splendens TaxID=208324 RepID=A0ABV0ZI13_9TELE
MQKINCLLSGRNGPTLKEARFLQRLFFTDAHANLHPSWFVEQECLLSICSGIKYHRRLFRNLLLHEKQIVGCLESQSEETTGTPSISLNKETPFKTTVGHLQAWLLIS